MHKYLFIVIAVTLLVTMTSCKTVEPMTMDHPDRIEYGSFGGFAGSYTEYKVVPDGNGWMQERLKGANVPLAAIDPQVLKQLTSVLKSQQADGYTINNPGNMTYFLRLCEDGEQNYELVWGGGEKVDPRVKIIYKTLVKLSKEYHPTR